MSVLNSNDDSIYLVNNLNFKEKVERALGLLKEAYNKYGDGLVVANSLGKDSMVTWDLAKKASPTIRGFIVTTRFKPRKTVEFMRRVRHRYPELAVYKNDVELPEKLYETNPDKCCEMLKVEPTRRALENMHATCWVTGLRCTEGRTREGMQEVETRDKDLVKLNPILIWKEREVWQYLALNQVLVNPLYGEGYRSLGCEPCTQISNAEHERAGRWFGTDKCGGECGIHTKPLKIFCLTK